MGESIDSLGQAVAALTSSSYFLPVIAALVMAFLGSLFTFCVRRKRADEVVSRRKKTDVVSPEDRVSEQQHSSDDRLATNTTTEEMRTHGEAGASENGVHPVISKDDEQTRPPIETRTESEKVDEETPAIRGESGREGKGTTEDETAAEEASPEEVVAMVNGMEEERREEAEEADIGQMVNGEANKKRGRWSFPPILEDFDLISTDMDPADLEQMFSDDRLAEIYLKLEPGGPGLGISIVGGRGSPSGDLPIIIKRVLSNSPAESDGRLKSGDELVAVNDTLLVGVAKDSAIEMLSNLSGNVRLLVLQDD